MGEPIPRLTAMARGTSKPTPPVARHPAEALGWCVDAPFSTYTSRDPAQLSLDFLSSADVLKPARRRYRARFRMFHDPVMRFLARVGVAGVHTILRRFWAYEGLHAAHGWRVLADLRKRGLIETRVAVKGRGRGAKHAATLTTAGYAAVGVSAPSGGPWPRTEDQLWHAIQFAEVLAGREAQGWQLADAADAWPIVKRWALRRRHSLAGSSSARQDHAILARTAATVPLDVLWHDGSGDVRLLLPLHRGRSWATLLRGLPPQLRLVGNIDLEIVCADADLYERSLPLIHRWATRHGYQFREHRIDPFQRLPDPRRMRRHARSVYVASGTPPSVTLDRPRIS